MSIIEKFLNIISNKKQIEFSKATNIATRLGIFQIKAYKDSEVEFLVVMSRGFYELKNPIVYLHTQMHQCDLGEEHTRINHNQIDSALKMIYKNGGVVIFFSNEGRDIDDLLIKLNAKKLKNEENIMGKANNDIGLKGFIPFYNSLGFILRDLKLNTINLVTNNQKAIELIESLDIKISKKTELVSFEYGER